MTRGAATDCGWVHAKAATPKRLAISRFRKHWSLACKRPHKGQPQVGWDLRSDHVPGNLIWPGAVNDMPDHDRQERLGMKDQRGPQHRQALRGEHREQHPLLGRIRLWVCIAQPDHQSPYVMLCFRGRVRDIQNTGRLDYRACLHLDMQACIALNMCCSGQHVGSLRVQGKGCIASQHVTFRIVHLRGGKTSLCELG